MENGEFYIVEKTSKQHVVQDNFGKKHKVRSKLETVIVDLLNEYQATWDYEVTKISYKVPESDHKYIVDFTLSNGILLEGKGWLKDHDERRKYLLIKAQHPDLDLRFVFANPNKFCGGTKMTHQQWADKNGFRWCSIHDTEQIQSWLKEKHDQTPNHS